MKEYVLKQPDTGTGTCQLVYPQNGGVYIGLGVGVHMVHVAWSGKSNINIHHQPDGTIERVSMPAQIPPSNTVVQRSKVVQLGSENPANRLYLQSGGALEPGMRIAVTVWRMSSE